MWDSVDSLKTISHALMWVTIVAGITTLLATAGRYYVDRRVASLSSQVRADDNQRRDAAALEREAALRAEVGNARAAAEEDRKARTALEEKFAFRTIPDAEFSQLVQKLGARSGQKFSIMTFMDDTESNQLAVKLLSALNSAKWVREKGGLWIVGVEQGVRLSIGKTPTAETKRSAELLAASLISIGIAARVIDDYVVEADRIDIRVGKKPIAAP